MVTYPGGISEDYFKHPLAWAQASPIKTDREKRNLADTFFNIEINRLDAQANQTDSLDIPECLLTTLPEPIRPRFGATG